MKQDTSTPCARRRGVGESRDVPVGDGGAPGCPKPVDGGRGGRRAGARGSGPDGLAGHRIQHRRVPVRGRALRQPGGRGAPCAIRDAASGRRGRPMTTHAHLSRPMHPMTSRIPKSTLDAAREVVRHCFESAAGRAVHAVALRPDARVSPARLPVIGGRQAPPELQRLLELQHHLTSGGNPQRRSAHRRRRRPPSITCVTAEERR